MILGVLGENRHHRDQKKTLKKKSSNSIIREDTHLSSH